MIVCFEGSKGSFLYFRLWSIPLRNAILVVVAVAAVVAVLHFCFAHLSLASHSWWLVIAAVSTFHVSFGFFPYSSRANKGQTFPVARCQQTKRNNRLKNQSSSIIGNTGCSTIPCLRASFSAISGGFWIPGYRWKAGRKAQAPMFYVPTCLTFLVTFE